MFCSFQANAARIVDWCVFLYFINIIIIIFIISSSISIIPTLIYWLYVLIDLCTFISGATNEKRVNSLFKH